MSSGQEKILLLQKECHMSQLRLKECCVELQKVRARVLQDLLDLETYHHASDKKAYDMQMAQLKVRNHLGNYDRYNYYVSVSKSTGA